MADQNMETKKTIFLVGENNNRRMHHKLFQSVERAGHRFSEENNLLLRPLKLL